MSPEAFQRGANFGVGAQSFNNDSSEEIVSQEEFESYEIEYPDPYSPNLLTFEFDYNDGENQDDDPYINKNGVSANKKKSTNSNKKNKIVPEAFHNKLNTGFGQNVFSKLTTGFFNTAYGAYSLSNVKSGYMNLAIGTGALRNNANGFSNIAIGNAAMQDWGVEGSSVEQLHSFNIAIGNSALAHTENARNNLAIGFTSQNSVQTSNNISFGNFALGRNTTSQFGEEYSGQNIAIGHSALIGTFDPYGFNNIGIGWEALYSNSAFQSIAIGSKAMRESGNGSAGNIAIGIESLKYIKGPNNIAIGNSSASGENNNGSGNISIGFGTLNENTSGWFNIAIGPQALWKNTEGKVNTATGSNAMRNNLIGRFNAAYGTWALGSNISGSFNAAIGWGSGRGGAGNISGDYNTFLGVWSGSLNEGQVNSTAIGYDAIVKQSNAIQLGNEDIELVETSGTVSATAFRGDGSQLTNLPIDSSIISRTDNIITIGDDQVTEVNTSGVVSASAFKGVGDNILIDTGEGQFKNLKDVYKDLIKNPWVEFLKSSYYSNHQYGSNSIQSILIFISEFAMPNNELPNNNVIFKYGGNGLKFVYEYMFNDSFFVIRFNSSPSGLKISFGPRSTYSDNNDASGLININNYVSRFGDLYRPVNLFLVDQDDDVYRIDGELVTDPRIDGSPNTITSASLFAILPTDTQWFKILAIGDQKLNSIVNGKFIETETVPSINERVINGSTINFVNSVGYPQIGTPSDSKGYVLSPKIIYYQEAKSFVVNEFGVTTYFE